MPTIARAISRANKGRDVQLAHLALDVGARLRQRQEDDGAPRRVHDGGHALAEPHKGEH